MICASICPTSAQSSDRVRANAGLRHTTQSVKITDAMPHAALLVIGEATSSAEEAEPTACWHQRHGLWLSNRKGELPSGTPVVARMAGPSNELLLDGIVSGPWAVSEFTDWQWHHQLPITWSKHIIRDVRGRDLLPENKALSRGSHIGLTPVEWATVQCARLRSTR